MEVKIAKRAKPVEFQAFSRSPVDIIIPFHGQYEKVTKLVESIMYATKSNPYQICLVDDCSPNEKFIEAWKDVPQVVTVRTPHHMGFGGALRVGYDATEQPWVVFMHSDCVVEDQNWLIEMGKSLLKWKEARVPVKMVAPRTNNPGDDSADKRLKAPLREKGDDMILASDAHLPLYCVMCHRELFYHIGGFIKPYPYGWFESEELAYRMNRAGFQQGICGRSWVRHHGAATVKALLEDFPEVKATMEENRTRCLRDMKSIT